MTDREDLLHSAQEIARRKDQRNRSEFAVRRDLRELDDEVASMEAGSKGLGDDIEATRRMIADELRRERWGHGPFHPDDAA
jgi:hypothetical protein